MDTLNKNIVEEFFEASSDTGLIAVYIMKLSHKEEIAFNYKRIFKEFMPDSVDYCYGFIIACFAFDLFTFTEKDDIINVTHFNSFAYDEIDDEIKELCSQSEAIKKVITKAERYFKE